MTIIENLRRKNRKVAFPDVQPLAVAEMDALQQETEDALHQAHDLDEQAGIEAYAPAQTMVEVASQLPAYLEHAPEVDDIGKITAASAVQQYESAALAIELMGKDLIEVAKQAEKMAADVKEALKYVEETAQQYRNEAKNIFDRIEKANLLTIKVRKTCGELRENITHD